MHDESRPAERRQDARYALALTGRGELLYRHLDHGENFEVRCLNISRGGIMVTLDPEARTGDVLRVNLLGPDQVTRYEFECTIQWLRRNTAGVLGRFLAGLAFRQAAPELVQQLLDEARRTSPTPEA